MQKIRAQPQREWEIAINNHLNKLSNNEEQKEELRRIIEETQLRLELVEKDSQAAIVLNQELIDQIDQRIYSMSDNPTNRWIYHVVNNMARS